MIKSPSRTTDQEDVVALIHAMKSYGREGGGKRRPNQVDALNDASITLLATNAALHIAEHHEEAGGNWDGQIWAERLSSTRSNSIAAMLYNHDGQDIRAVVTSWLLSLGWVEMTYRDKRWCFSEDEIAIYDDEDQLVAFYCYHYIPSPSIQAVTTLIDQMSLL